MARKKAWLTFKRRMLLFLFAFFGVVLVMFDLSYYQSKKVLQELDTQTANFHAISQFQVGAERSLSALSDYRWEYGDDEALFSELHSASSTMKAWLWRIDGDINSVSEEEYLLCSAINTTYKSYAAFLSEIETLIEQGSVSEASHIYYEKAQPCGGYLTQYSQQLLETAITESQSDYAALADLNDRIKTMQAVAVGVALLVGILLTQSVLRLLTPVQQMIAASNAIGRGELDTPDIPVPHQDEIGLLASAFNHMKHSMAEQINTMREKSEIERELHRQKTQTLELQTRMERSRLQQLRSQIDPHFLFNTLNVILQTAGIEKAYRTQALITALAHLLRYSLMSNDEQVPIAREIRIVDEYYSIYHVRFGDRIRMEWRISDALDLTETMMPSFILQPIVENAFKHGIGPKEEGGLVRIRIHPLPDKGLLCIRIIDNGQGMAPELLASMRKTLTEPGQQWEHIGIYNVAERLKLIDSRCRIALYSHKGRGTSVVLYLPLNIQTEEEYEDDPSSDRG